jgi:hypothetical protein
MRVLNKEVLAGIALLAFGSYFLVTALGYGLGTPRRIGPGFFPLIVGSNLVLVSVAITGLALRSSATTLRVAWRPLIAIGLGISLFVAVVPRFGLAPAVWLSAFVAAFGDREATVFKSALLAAGICLGVIATFRYGLGVPIPLVQGLG